jgi:hypothetical protein
MLNLFRDTKNVSQHTMNGPKQPLNRPAGPFIGQKYQFNRPWPLFFASGGRKNGTG